ncbi:MAG: tetratricopeptide repeat protein [Muribaculaceae bacterium]|nr:tetratricopeptide repeat protein [Muribaculaceae bacterium]
MRIRRLIPIAITVGAILGGWYAGLQPAAARDKGKSQAEVIRQKARYYYLEGGRHSARGENAEALEYYRHAHEIDPSYPEASFSYGQQRLGLNWDTLQSPAELGRSFSLMRPYVEAYPKDYEESTFYAYVGSKIDSLDEAARVLERTVRLLPERTNTLLSLSDLYLYMGKDSAAYSAMDRYQIIEGTSPQLSLKKISYMLSRNDTTGALRETTELVNANPHEASFQLLKANLFNLMEEKDSVLAYYTRAEQTAPGSGRVKMALANFYREQGDTTRYDEKIYEALLADDYELEDKVALLAQYLQKLIYDKSDTSRGDYLFKVLEQQYPHEPDVLDLESRYTAAKGNFNDAIEKVSYAIDLRHNDENLWIQKIQYQISADKKKEAVETYEEALTAFEPTGHLHLVGATAAQIGEQYDKAIEIYGRLMKLIVPKIEPDSVLDLKILPASLPLAAYEQLSDLFVSVGDCLYNSKKVNRAFIAYDNALELNPDNAMGLNNYAYFLSENEGDLKKAEEMSRRSLDGENAKNPTFLDTYAWILHKLNRDAEAETFQRDAISEAGGDAATGEELWDHFGDILMANGKTEEAIEAWTKAAALAQDPTEIQKKINNAK